MARVRPKSLLDGGRVDRTAPVTLELFDPGAHDPAHLAQPMANRPLSRVRIVSPRDSTLVSAASHAPWPLAA